MSVRRQGGGQTRLCHSNSVNPGASGLQLRRAFFIDRERGLQPLLAATG